MKQTINFSQFIDAFQSMNRIDHFSHEGLKALFDYLENYEEDTGEQIELDVITLCCDYEEYKNLEAFNEDYNNHGSYFESIEKISNYTTVIPIQDTTRFIIQRY